MTNQRWDCSASNRKGGWSPARSSPRWASTDDAAIVSLITSVAVGAMLMIPAFLLLDQLSPTLGPALTATPRSLEGIGLD